MKFKEQFLLWIILIVLFGSLVYAETSLGIFKRDTCTNIFQLCNNCTYVNISSVVFPNSTIIAANISMTKINNEYVYSFCNTSTLGTYRVNGYGDPDGITTVWTYDFEITETGAATETRTLPIYVLIACSAILTFIAFGMNDDLLKLLFIVISLILMIINISIATMETFAQITSMMKIVFIVVLYGGLFFLVIYFIIVFLKNIFAKGERMRIGEDDEEEGRR